MQRKRGRVESWVSLDRPMSGTPHDWEDWASQKAQLHPVRWRLLALNGFLRRALRAASSRITPRGRTGTAPSPPQPRDDPAGR